VGNKRQVAHELGKVLVVSLRDLGLYRTQGHGLLDDVVVVGHGALVHFALEELRGIVCSTGR
jgi:hypothetical protein